ncbi:MATE family efflux transporter [Peptoniphilus equinus]|uniref:Probable multidrug resistance protein NorM n=1 Tax=Peptoniphilus equinus TaxID=3016343 RepID=A0ABY7QU25_9FIRM|nr:MATE family efflux transporter [Peptoniphilus equinus]WBW50285.1 MATE family efflux transporter [Peptoniphilus equinus]
MNSEKMATMPVGELLLKLSIPLMVAMLIQALYNIVDSYFVSLINQDAFTAVTLAFPVQNLIIGLAVGTGVGTNALLSKSLGAKDHRQTEKVMFNALILVIIHSVLFVIFSRFATAPYLSAQTDNPIVRSYGEDYLGIVTGLALFVNLQIMMERLLQSTGRTTLTLITQGIGAVINIILDPILIFGYFGFPELGVAGAAVATVIGQGVASLLGLYLNHRYNHEVAFVVSKPDLETIKKIYEVGLPSVALISLSSVTIYFLNKILGHFTEAAVAVYGAYFRIQNFVFLPLFGLTNGLVPALAYNYGAKNRQRCYDLMRVAFKIGYLITLAGLVLFLVAPGSLIALFNPSEEMAAIGVVAFRWIALSFPLAAYNVVAEAVYQSFGNGMLGLVAALLRQIIVLLPAAYLLALSGRLDFVWASYVIAEVANTVFCYYYMKHFVHRTIEAQMV